METLNFHRAARRCNETLEFLTLASTPCSEDCIQAGNDLNMQLVECAAYVNQLTRLHGLPPNGAEFFFIENIHEFGIYYEAGIFYVPTQEESDEDSVSEVYALKCEHSPDYWDAEAIAELKANGHPKYNVKVIPIKKVA